MGVPSSDPQSVRLEEHWIELVRLVADHRDQVEGETLRVSLEARHADRYLRGLGKHKLERHDAGQGPVPRAEPWRHPVARVRRLRSRRGWLEELRQIVTQRNGGACPRRLKV